MRGVNAKHNNWSTGSRRTRSADDFRSQHNAGSPRCGLRRCSRCWRADALTRRLDRLLTEAERPEVLWQASATLGEVRFGERRFVEAAMAFDRAIEIMKNETRTPSAPSKFEIEGLIDRAAQARLLAANVAGAESGGFVRTARDQRDGKLGGIYSPSVRGIVPRAIPVPITFEYAKTTFTDVGAEAARELLSAIKEQQPDRIMLVGHTDVRGAAETN